MYHTPLSQECDTCSPTFQGQLIKNRKALKNVQTVGQTIFFKILVFPFEKYYLHMLCFLRAKSEDGPFYIRQK